MFAWFWQTTFLPLQKRQIMANNYINRYAWLIDVVRRHGFITLTDISDLWQRSVLNETGEPLPERTFHNHRKAIEEILGIEILFNKSRGYYLDMSQVCSPEMTEWLLTSLTVNSAIKESCDLKDRIIFEDMIHYTMVKTTYFNGVSHPSVGILKIDGSFEMWRKFGYEDYKNRLC